MVDATVEKGLESQVEGLVEPWDYGCEDGRFFLSNSFCDNSEPRFSLSVVQFTLGCS